MKSSLDCLMSGISQKVNDILETPKNEVKKSRRKRSVASEKLKYGKCPKDFVKLSEFTQMSERDEMEILHETC